MRSRRILWVVYAALVGLIFVTIISDEINGASAFFFIVAIVALFASHYLRIREDERRQRMRDEYFTFLERHRIQAAELCSSCHQPMNTPGCCTSPESKIAYPQGFHTHDGGCEQGAIDSSQK